MGLNSIHLNKALKLFYLSDRKLISELRKSIRQELQKDQEGSGGGDFYSPFWADVKKHMIGQKDIRDSCDERIIANRRSRKNLYPDLCDGFINWWQNTRKWKNYPVTLIEDSVKNKKHFQEFDITIKIENLISVELDEDNNRYIYPYFYKDGPLSEEAGRLGLWLISELFESYDLSEFRILDVFQSKTFSIDKSPLLGDEERIFLRKIEIIKNKTQELLDEY